MFGNKLRSWMEAVRPKKKQQRKDKQTKVTTPNNGTTKNLHPPSCKEHDVNFSLQKKSFLRRFFQGNVDRRSVETLANTCVQNSRYSGTNLSSPESAYSTGYSTDGTSPGAPPEYYINIKTGERLLSSLCFILFSKPHNQTSQQRYNLIIPKIFTVCH